MRLRKCQIETTERNQEKDHGSHHVFIYKQKFNKKATVLIMKIGSRAKEWTQSRRLHNERTQYSRGKERGNRDY